MTTEIGDGRTGKRPFVCLDLSFHSDPKVLNVGNAAAGLYTRALSYSGAHKLDGYVPARWAREAGTSKERSKLVDAALWIEVADGYRIANWTRYQHTRAQIEALQAAHRLGAMKTNEARWGNRSSDRSRGRS